MGERCCKAEPPVNAPHRPPERVLALRPSYWTCINAHIVELTDSKATEVQHDLLLRQHG